MSAHSRPHPLGLTIPPGELVRVEAPRFVAGLILRDGRVIFAAPILHWTRGMRWRQLAASLRRQGFTVIILG